MNLFGVRRAAPRNTVGGPWSHGPAAESKLQHRMLDRIIGLTFWVVAVICMVDFNDVVRMWFGVERALSVPLLLCCFVMLTGLLRVRLMDALGWPGILILGSLLTYSGLGIVVAVASGTELQDDSTWYLVRHLSSVVLIAATAVGGSVLLRSAGHVRVLRGFMLIAAGSCVLMMASPRLLDIFQNPPEDGTYRYFGAFSDPNMAAMVACFGLVSALSFIRAGRYHVLAYGTLLLSVAALVGTFSRTALVVLVVLLVGAIMASRGRERTRIAGGLAVIAVIAAMSGPNLGLGALETRQLQRWESLVEILELTSVDDVSLAGRLTLWSLALEQTLEAPLFGNGIGRLHHLDNAWYNDEGVLLGAHNQYLILAGEAGFLPLLLYLLYLGWTVRAGFRQIGDAPILGAVSGWTVVVALFGLAFHGILTLKASTFIVGLSCAAAAAPVDRAASPRTAATASSSGA